MSTSDPRLADLIYQYANAFSIQGDGRVRCELNGHVFPASSAYDTVTKFVNGPKFRKLKKQAEEQAELAKLEPFLSPSKNFPGRLWCALTKQLLAADLGTARRHMRGRKFVNAQARFQEDKQPLYAEPSPEVTSEEEQEEAEAEEAEVAIKDQTAPPHEAEILSAGKGQKRTAGKKERSGRGSEKGARGKLAQDSKGSLGSKAKAVLEAPAGEIGGKEPPPGDAEFWVPEWAEEAQAGSGVQSAVKPAGVEKPQPGRPGRKKNPGKQKAKRLRVE